MQTFTQTFAGALTWQLNVPGNYFILLAANNAVNIRFYKQNKKLNLGDVTAVFPGLQAGPFKDVKADGIAFDRVEIDTSAADTIQVGIGDGSITYNRFVAITGNANVIDVGVTPAAQFISAAALGAGAPVNAIAAVSNVNGYIYHGCILFCDGPNKTEASVLAKATAPASSVDGLVLKMLGVGTNVQAVGSAINPDYEIVGKRPFNVAAGLRLDAISVAAQATTRFIASYTLK